MPQRLWGAVAAAPAHDRGSEDIQVVADHHLPAIQLPDLLQERLFGIRPAHPARVRPVVQDQTPGRAFVAISATSREDV
jgi:hypothetical protein